MSIHSQLPYDQSTSHARIPAGGINLIASIDSVSEAQFTASFFGSTKALHGEVATTSPATTTHNHSTQQYSINSITTSTGAIAKRYAYSAYGEPTILDGSGTVIASSAINNRYGYTGREWDATVGLYHFRARWMSPKTGRFLAVDPIEFEGSQWNLYEYVNANSLSRTDPTGLSDSVSAYYKKCMEEGGKKNPTSFCRCMCAPIPPTTGKDCDKECLSCMTNFTMGPCKCLCKQLTTNTIDERRCFEACDKKPEKPTCDNMFPFLPKCGGRNGFGGGLQSALVPGSSYMNDKPSSWCPGGTHYMYKDRKTKCPFSILCCPCCGTSKTGQPTNKEECKLTQMRF
jgi:RHS repeat-associated protein